MVNNMKNKIKYLCLLASLGVSFAGLTSCNTAKVHVDIVSNGEGTIKIQHMDENGYVPLNTTCKIYAIPEDGYYLDSLYQNKKNITQIQTFTAIEDTDYVVTGLFAENNGEYQVSLDGPTGVEIGETGQLNATVYGLNSNVEYFVSDPDLASVSSDGVITGKKAGFVTVRATAAGSNYRDPVTASHVVFIEPHYIARMVEAIKVDELDKGLNFRGNISLNFDPSSGADPDGNSWVFPYSLSLQKDENEKILTDFTLSTSDSTSMVTFLLSQVLGTNYSNAKEFSFAHIRDGNIQYHLLTNDNLVGDYKSLSINDDILPAITEKVYSLAKDAKDSDNNLLSSFVKDYKNRGKEALDFASWCPLINSVLEYSTDPSEGISVRQSFIYTIQDFLEENRQKAIDGVISSITNESLKMFAGQLVAGMLPGTLQDIRTTFTLDSDGSFGGFDFRVKDNKTVSSNNVEYTYIGIDYNKKDNNFTENYFTNLKNLLASSEKDKANIAKVDALKLVYETKLKSSSKITGSSSSTLDKLYSVYNASHLISDFSSSLAEYRLGVLDLLDKDSGNYVENTALIPGDYITEPYAGFDVTLSSDTTNVLQDEWSAKAGDSFVISNLHTIGGDETNTTINSDEVTFALSSNAKKGTTTYVTFDKETKTINVLANPTKDTYVTLTCSGANYSALTYRFHLSAQ